MYAGRQLWGDLWQSQAVPSSGWLDTSFSEIQLSYAQDHRAYHTIDHIEACLGLFHELVEDSDGLLSGRGQFIVGLSLWMHDVVYDPHAKAPYSEQASAEWAARLLREQAMDPAIIETVSHLILGTAGHKKALYPYDAWVNDIDLSILGSDPSIFDKYERDIRTEYGFVPEDIFRRERAKILVDFLSRDELYGLTPCRERFQKQARANLAHSVKRLLFG